MLAGQLDGRIAQAGDADATWQSTFDSSLHKIRCKESEGYGHVDLAHAALLALSDAFHVPSCIRHKLVDPTVPWAIDAIKVARRSQIVSDISVLSFRWPRGDACAAVSLFNDV